MKFFEISSMAIMMIAGADAAYSHGYSNGYGHDYGLPDGQVYKNGYNIVTGVYSYKPLSPYNRQLALAGYVDVGKPSYDSPYPSTKSFNSRYVPPKTYYHQP